MDCRKARYFLVASFDGPLERDTRKELSYHLKDCRTCRHEAFYYRELFAAEQQLEELKPSEEFNERLLAQIRLREAQAGWPRTAESKIHKPRPRWHWVLVPSLFATAALLAFVLIRPASDNGTGPALQTAAELQEANERVVLAGPSDLAIAGERPRYNYQAMQNPVRSGTQTLFELTPAAPELRHLFADQVELLVSGQQNPLATQRLQARTRYVLPVVNHASSRERIY